MTAASTWRRAVGAIAALVLLVAGLAATGPATAVVADTGQGFTVTAGDLRFILRQIRIAERHSATRTASDPCGTLVGSAPNQVPDRLTAYGLRTVDGTCNNLFDGRSGFAAADRVFPRLTSPVFTAAEASPPGFPARSSSSYAQKRGDVYDSGPRLASNLIVDQTSTNPAAVAAAALPTRSQSAPGLHPCTTDPDPLASPPVAAVPTGCVPSHQTLFIPNVTTDVGLSPPYNSLFTFFGQFFDHGVDQTVKGGADVYVPLRSDDPLRTLGPDGKAGTGDEVPASRAFMVLTRARNQAGPDGVVGDDPATAADESADDVQDAVNTDSPWVDNSQTYASHASQQVFLREFTLANGRPVATGKLLGGLGAHATGMSTWASVKKQAAELLGLALRDQDVTDVPMLATDPYGEFLAGPHGLPQYVLRDGSLREGSLSSPVPVGPDVRHFDTPFLTDIAHNADPSPQDTDHSPATPPVAPVPDADTAASANFAAQPPGTYDDEMLDAHAICGDGRCNENIALTSIHQVFHSEHNRLVADVRTILDRPENSALKADWENVSPGANDPAVSTFTVGDRLFQAARFVNEMEYQHTVFEEFARKVQPAVHPFHVYSPDTDPAISAEFAHAVYRFGHSMLTDTVSRTNADGSDASMPLLSAFLNPPALYDGGPAGPLTPEQGAASVFMGSSDQVGNELDEFMTETLRNNLVGLPLDLASLNIARGRDAGVPRLNQLRREIHAATNDGQLAPYTSWADFGQHLKHPESLVNFIAAYGTHPSIVNASSPAARRAAAKAIVDPTAAPATDPASIPADAAAFLFGTDGRTLAGCDVAGAGCRDWSDDPHGTVTGLDQVDLWDGGLAEVTNPFGGLLGSTFNYVFQTQLEHLQDGDRLYYLNRTPGMNLRAQLEGNSFSELVQRNTDGASALKADAFATADCRFTLANLDGTPAGFAANGSTVKDDPGTSDCDENKLLLRKPDGTIQYRAVNSVDPSGINGQAVYQGTTGTDRVYGGNDNDTFWGGPARDWIEGGSGDDVALGGDGNDVLTDLGGADVPKGGPGNDAIDAGPGDDIPMGGTGADFINGGTNDNETFAGEGNDYVIAGAGADAAFGGGGDDWIEGGTGQDLLIGDHGAPFFDDPAESRPGSDVFVGQTGENDYDAEGGDDLMSQNPAIDRNAGAGGFDWAFHAFDTAPANDDLAINNNLPGLPVQVVVNRDRWQETEAISGSSFDDVLRGDDAVPRQVGGAGFSGCDALDATGLSRITGLAALIPALTGSAADVAASSPTGTCPLTGPVWGDGNVLIGGPGSDTIEGRGADDVIDGDKYLSVRISVRTDPARPDTEVGSTDLMEHTALSGTFGPGTTGKTLQKAVFDGDVDPGDLVVVREVLSPTAADAASVDTAVFSGPRSRYTVEAVAGTVVVTDSAGTDGVDRLTGVEKLRFADVTVDAPVSPPAPSITSVTPGDGAAVVAFAPGTGTVGLTAFRIQVFSGGSLITTVNDIAAAVRSSTVTGLTNGTAYTFRVVAVAGTALSAPSAESAPVTPVGGPPRVLGSTPADGELNAPVAADQTVTLSKPVVNVGTTTVTLRTAAGVVVPRTVTFDAATRLVTVDPTATLVPGTTYVLTLRGSGVGGIRDSAGLLLADTSITFRTRPDTTPPAVVAVTPADGAVNVARGANVTAQLTERVVGADASTVVLRNEVTGTRVLAVVSLNAAGTLVTLNPVLNLQRNTVYRLSLAGGPTAIRDAFGNPLTGSSTTFRTAP